MPWLLDIFMPERGMDGVEVLRALRTMAHANESVGIDTLKIGAFDYVPKRFDFDVLDRIVMAAVAAGRRCAIASAAVAHAARRPPHSRAVEPAAACRASWPINSHPLCA
jgi:DNA-binding NarL/FixJ family response regulator